MTTGRTRIRTGLSSLGEALARLRERSATLAGDEQPLRAELFSRLGLRTFSPTKVGIELAAEAIFDSDGAVARNGFRAE